MHLLYYIIVDYSNNTRELMPDFLSKTGLEGNIVHIEHILGVEPKTVDLPVDLHASLKSALIKKGIQQLYSHQLASWNAARDGKDVVVVRPTASGQTLCYNLPVMQSLLEATDSSAFYLFPTKALSQDQQAELSHLVGFLDEKIKTNIYDGDTPQAARKLAREQASIVITNPDMLHSGILPNHAKWSRFFTALKYIVIDEMHIYRGVFGSHVANVIRRLLRVALFYGATPQFILCSATITNPESLATALTGRCPVLVDNNGAPKAERLLFLYNPPLVDPVQGIRRSTTLEAVQLCAKLLRQGLKTILFARSRLRVELIASYLNDYFRNAYNENNHIKIEPYRAGLLPTERRAIEKGLRDGTIQGVVSTNALELGIDIGGLEAAVIAGWPGSLASFRQQTGRAGRRQGISYEFFIATGDPMDQYLLENPERIMLDAAESAHIDPDNPYIYLDHVKCAAFELPFCGTEKFGTDLTTVLVFLEEAGIVRKSQSRWYWSSEAFPAEKISLRSASADNVVIIDETGGRNVVIGEMDRPGAKEFLFEKAIYIHRGNQFIVRKLDVDNRLCSVEESDVNYFTDAVVRRDIRILAQDEYDDFKLYHLACGDVLVVSQAERFKKLRFNTHENIGYGEIYLPPEELQTRAVIFIFGDTTVTGQVLTQSGFEIAKANILAALTFLIKNMAPLFLLCDKGDLGVAWKIRDDHFETPALYVWDRYPGGTGLSEALHPHIQALFSFCLERLNHCGCRNGCPSCIGLPDASLGVLDDRKTVIAGFLELLARLPSHEA